MAALLFFFNLLIPFYGWYDAKYKNENECQH